MGKGGILAAIFVVAYLGFEVYTVKKARHRMEPPHIFNQFVAAHRAFEVCQPATSETYDQFRHNFNIMRQRTVEELSKVHATDSLSEIDRRITERVAQNELLADSVIAAHGCADIEVWKLLRRFEMFAALRIG